MQATQSADGRNHIRRVNQCVIMVGKDTPRIDHRSVFGERSNQLLTKCLHSSHRDPDVGRMFVARRA